MIGKLVTLHRHIISAQRKFPEAKGDFSGLLIDIATAVKIISAHVNKAGLADVLGRTGSINVQGEQVQKLDEFANQTFINCLNANGHLCVLATEEDESIIQIPAKYPKGKYVCLLDPLDGSSNIDANVSIGSIFSIFKRVTEPDDSDGTLGDCLQEGYKQICAGYAIYGSSTMLVYTVGNGVNGFTLDPSFGEFILSHRDMTIPSEGKIYSVNESNFDYWDEEFKTYIRWVKKIDPYTNRPRNCRYIGSMVADFHRNLIYGGVFCYPNDTKNPNGKLRLLYEANPMAFIVEQAGGKASTGRQRIMEITPRELHQRVPLIIGSPKDVGIVEEFVQNKRVL